MKTTPKLSRLARAVAIYKVVTPALSQRGLFTAQHHGPGTLWVSEDFHIASAVTPDFRSFDVWPILNRTGLLEHPDSAAKAMNLHRLNDGSFDLGSFRSGDWERDLLRYVGAPLGLLTLRAC